MTSPAAIRPVVDEWKLIKRQDNLVKSVVFWPNHCNERLGLTSKRVLSSNRKMKVKILQECFSLITETSAYTFKKRWPKSPMFTQVGSIPVDEIIWRNWQRIAKSANFVKFAKIANVHPRGVNTSGWTNLTKLEKYSQNRQSSPNCCQYQWMT